MSIPDTLLEEWIDLASGASPLERAAWRDQANTDPLAAKRRLGERLADRYHGAGAGAGAREAFDLLHREREIPEDLPVVRIDAGSEGRLWIAHALKRSGLAASTSEGRRLVEQGGIRVDGEPVAATDCHLPPGSYVLQRGRRRFVRLEIDGAEVGDE
jgi:tyrosyl-tRNA synthetase